MALKNAKLKFRVTYDRNNDRVLSVQKPNNKYILFNTNKYKINYHNTKNREVSLVQTVSEYKSRYIKHQLRNVELWMEIYYK